MSTLDTVIATAIGLAALALLPSCAGEHQQPPVVQPAPPKPAPAAEMPPQPPGQPLRAGSFPRSFLIPGTDTSLSIGGH